MQPLTKALRRRLRRLAPELAQRDIDGFERERRAAMDAALREDPLYAEALGAAAPAAPAARAAAPRTAPAPARVRQLGALLQRAAEAERRALDDKAERALARQGNAARPKRPLAPVALLKRAAGKATAKRSLPKRTAPKPPPRRPGKAAPGKPPRRGPRPVR